MFRSLFLLPVFLLLFAVFIAGAQGKSPSDNAVDELFLLANVAYSIIRGVIAPAGISPRGEIPRRHPSISRVY